MVPCLQQDTEKLLILESPRQAFIGGGCVVVGERERGERERVRERESQRERVRERGRDRERDREREKGREVYKFLSSPQPFRD